MTDEDCDERTPLNKCRNDVCRNNACVEVERVCPEYGDACIVGACLEDTGACDYRLRSHQCCTNESTSFCHASGEPCARVECSNVSATTGLGVCVEVIDDGDDTECCATDADCERDGDLCTRGFCDERTHRCAADEIETTCYDMDCADCFEAACDPTDGECRERRAAGDRKCPGACCRSGARCSEVDFFECTRQLAGVWLDSNTSCADAACP